MGSTSKATSARIAGTFCTTAPARHAGGRAECDEGPLPPHEPADVPLLDDYRN